MNDPKMHHLLCLALMPILMTIMPIDSLCDQLNTILLHTFGTISFYIEKSLCYPKEMCALLFENNEKKKNQQAGKNDLIWIAFNC